MSNSSRVTEFLSPNGHNGSIRTDFDGLKRERVLVLNDTINAVSRAGESYVSMDNSDGVIHAGVLLDILLLELEDSIIEVPHD